MRAVTRASYVPGLPGSKARFTWTVRCAIPACLLPDPSIAQLLNPHGVAPNTFTETLLHILLGTSPTQFFSFYVGA